MSFLATSFLVTLTQQLIACPSVTPEDANCQAILSERLQNVGFQVQHLPFEEVSNFWAWHGQGRPLFVFVGHTDVVPPGPTEKWDTPPFEPSVRNGFLYGRGSADMKGSLAAALVAYERFVSKHPDHVGTIAWLITSDEEGPSVNGTAEVVEVLKSKGIVIDYCLVGEPTCEKKLGDTVKVGRRGSLSGHLVVQGKQGHIAYPQLARNPIHLFSPVLADLLTTSWDQGSNPYFQPTSFQFSNVNSGTGAGNVIPNQLEAKFNFRYQPDTDAESLEKKFVEVLKRHDLVYQLDWQHGGRPFLSPSGRLRTEMLSAIKEVTGVFPEVSTSGGTSDARFIAPLGAEIVEFGPCNRSIHQINEHVSIIDLERLSLIYELLLEKLLVPPK